MQSLAWDDFRLVNAIAEAKGLPGAAERLGVSVSTVFRRLARVEAALGTALFERHRAGYALTAAGEEMVGLAARLADEVTAFTRRVAGREPSPSGVLRLTTSDALFVHLLAPLLARFRERCPDVRLDIILGNQALNLSKRDADVAVRAMDGPPETLVGRRVARIAWALYGRAADDPAERPWVALGDDLAAMRVARHVRGHVPGERIVCEVNSVLGLAEAVEAGIGIGHLPCLIGDTRPGLARLAAPEPRLAADLWLLTHPDLRQAPRVRVFLDFLAAEIAKLRGLIEGERGSAPAPA